MKHSPRTPLRVLAASLSLCGLLGTTTHAASTWRDFAIDRKPGNYSIGNQDFSTNDCIGWSSRGALLGQPVHTLGGTIPSASTIYARATRLKALPGEKMDTRHAAEALLEMGFIDDYETLQNPYEIWDWLKYEGPVAAAIYWDESMTKHRGTLRPIPVDCATWTTHKAHAITILGWNPKERAFVFTPNLGTGWGRKGFALLRETDFPFVFVNAVGFEHGNELDAKAIGETPPGDREKLRAVAATNVWYTAPGPMKTAKLGESAVEARVKVNVGTAITAMAMAMAMPKAEAEASIREGESLFTSREKPARKGRKKRH